jgi:hypothetical protein
MKNIFIHFTSALFLILSPVIAHAQYIRANQLEPFTKIAVFGNFDIEIIKGEKDSIRLESEADILGNVKIKNEDKVLKLSATDKLFSKYHNLKVKLIYRELVGIQLSGGSELQSSLPIQANSMEIAARSGATVNLKGDLMNLKINVDEGATITLEGKGRNSSIECGTGGIFNAYDFTCDSMIVKTNMGGIAKVAATKMLDASVSAGGQISYRGEPTIKKEKTFLGGSIEKVVE